MSTPNDPSSISSAPQGPILTSVARAGKWLPLVLGGSGVLCMVLMLVAKDPVATLSMTPVAAFCFLAVWFFGSGKVVVDDSGVRVYGGGVLKMLNVTAEDVASAEAKDISPANYGGWGLRVSGKGTAFIIKGGPGLVVKRKKGNARVYSVGRLEEGQLMATRLNELATNNGR